MTPERFVAWALTCSRGLEFMRRTRRIYGAMNDGASASHAGYHFLGKDDIVLPTLRDAVTLRERGLAKRSVLRCLLGIARCMSWSTVFACDSLLGIYATRVSSTAGSVRMPRPIPTEDAYSG